MLVESGPTWAADHLRGACELPIPPPDPDLADAAARWLLDHVWLGFELPDPVTVDPAETVDVDVIGFLPEAILPTADPRVVVAVSAAGAQVPLDVLTGALVVRDVAPVPAEVRLPPGLGRWFATSAVGDRGGPALTAGNWAPLPVADSTGGRVLAHDGEQWRFVGEGCDGHLVFPADGRAWLAGWDAGLHWAPVP